MIRARGRATWAWVSWCQVLCRINPFSLLCGWCRDSCCKGKKWGLGEGVYSNNLREAVSVPKPEPFLIHPGGSCVGTQLWLVTRLTPKQKTCENRRGWLWPHLYETKDIKLCLRFGWWINSTSWGKKKWQLTHLKNFESCMSQGYCGQSEIHLYFGYYGKFSCGNKVNI